MRVSEGECSVGSWSGLGWGSGRPGQAHTQPCCWVGSRAAVSHLGLGHHTLLEQAVQQLLRRAPGSLCQGKL